MFLRKRWANYLNLTKNVNPLPTSKPDTKVICHASPFVLFEQINLMDLYKQYLEITLVSRKIFRKYFTKWLLQNVYKIRFGAQLHIFK